MHKPYIDAVTYQSPFAADGRMRRVSEVIDCWYDSGAMPFAQWGYPHTGPREFEQQFPADFISEALDQTRGWFYSQLAISTLLFGDSTQPDADRCVHAFPHPFRNCIVLGLMLGEDGSKMSKSKRNYREPNEIFDRYGADAMRWYFFANQPPWTSIRYSESAIRDSIPEFLLRLWNVYSFFVIYANIDGFAPEQLRRRRADLTSTPEPQRERLPAGRPAQRTGSLDPQRVAPHDRRRDRDDGSLTTTSPPAPHQRVRRCAEQLVRPPQPRSVLERSARIAGQAGRLLDAVRMPGDDREADCALHAISGGNHVAEPGRRV